MNGTILLIRSLIAIINAKVFAPAPAAADRPIARMRWTIRRKGRVGAWNEDRQTHGGFRASATQNLKNRCPLRVTMSYCNMLHQLMSSPITIIPLGSHVNLPILKLRETQTSLERVLPSLVAPPKYDLLCNCSVQLAEEEIAIHTLHVYDND